MKNRNKQITVGAILSYVHIAIGAVITLLYTPFMVHVLGKSEYGLYNTVVAVISSLSILSLGFGSSYIRFFSKFNEENNEGEIRKLNGMFLIIFSVIGGVALCCGLFLSCHLDMVFDKGLTESELKTAEKLMLLLTVNLTVSFPASVFTSIITSREEFIFQKTMLLIRQVASPLVCIPILLMGYASVGMVVSTVAINLIIDVINVVYCINYLHVRFSFRRFDWAIFSQLAVYSGFIAINMIVDQVNLNIDKILLGRFCGTEAVAVYSVGFTLYTYYSSFSTSISNVFTPRIHSIWSNTLNSITQKNEKLSDLFAKVGRIQFVILFLVCTGFILFGKQFIFFWVGNNYSNSYYVMLILAISAIVPLTQNLGIEIQRAKNKHQFRSIVYAVMAAINLVLSIYLCQLYGEIGSAIGTAISFIIANTIIMNIFYHKVLNINVRQYWSNVARISISVVPAYVIGYIFCRKVNTFVVYNTLIGIVLYTICYLLSLYILGTRTEEKIAVSEFIKGRIGNNDRRRN